MKIVLGVVAVPLVALAGAFGYGMYLEASAPEELPPVATAAPEEVVPAATEAPAAEEPTAAAEVAEVAEVETHEAPELVAGEAPLETEPVAVEESGLVVPAELDAAGAQGWILENHLIGLEDGALVEDRSLFQSLSAVDAVRLHAALLAGGSAFEAMRLHFFALCGELPEAERRTFARDTGAVFSGTENEGAGSHLGDFTRLLFLQTSESESVYARAVRDFAAVLEEDEMVHALEDLGAIKIEDSSASWTIRVAEKMGDFDPETLGAIRGVIRDELFGDRRYLRMYLADLAEEKRLAASE